MRLRAGRGQSRFCAGTVQPIALLCRGDAPSCEGSVTDCVSAWARRNRMRFCSGTVQPIAFRGQNQCNGLRFYALACNRLRFCSKGAVTDDDSERFHAPNDVSVRPPATKNVSLHALPQKRTSLHVTLRKRNLLRASLPAEAQLALDIDDAGSGRGEYRGYKRLCRLGCYIPTVFLSAAPTPRRPSLQRTATATGKSCS